jgi:hypothetical protein
MRKEGAKVNEQGLRPKCGTVSSMRCGQGAAVSELNEIERFPRQHRVIPAKPGIEQVKRASWISAFAGMKIEVHGKENCSI